MFFGDLIVGAFIVWLFNVNWVARLSRRLYEWGLRENLIITFLRKWLNAGEVLWTNSARWAMLASGVVVLGVALVSSVFLRSGYLWFSFVGVVVGVVIHQLVEIWIHNPKLTH
jgi:hypothetical protein